MSFVEMRVPEEAKQIAGKLLAEYPHKKIWLFNGNMGAGKTTLIKGFCKALGVTDTTSSPTFSIVNEYRCPDGTKLFHFDFYRLKDESEALDIGVEEYFESGNYCFIEWPEKVERILPSDYIEVRIDEKDKVRKITVIPSGKN